jgi:Domain of unknown function (DUF4260)
MTTLAASPALTTAAAAKTTLGLPVLLLRVEGLITLAAAVAAYRALGGTWGVFALCFLVPDLSMLGYLVSPKVGAYAYNAGHSLLLPALLAGGALALGSVAAGLAALIWVAHIGFDRALGYGLKETSSFFDTHLGRVGRAATQR